MVRASVFQTESCGFESHYPLNVETYSKFFRLKCIPSKGSEVRVLPARQLKLLSLAVAQLAEHLNKQTNVSLTCG